MKDFFPVNPTDIDMTSVLILATLSFRNSYGKCTLSRESISEYSGVANVKTVDAHLNKLIEAGKITKSSWRESNCLLHNAYTLTKWDKGYVNVKPEIFSLDKKLIPFVIKLAAMTYDNTPFTYKTDAEIIKTMGISKPTFIKLRDLAIESKAIFRIRGGYGIQPMYIRFTKNNDLSKALIKAHSILEPLQDIPEDKWPADAKILNRAVKTHFCDVRINPLKYVMKCQAGLIKARKSSQRKEAEPQTYKL